MQNPKFRRQNSPGVTLTELLVIAGILIILSAIAVPAFRFFQKESDLNNSAEEIINTLRLAQNKTLASEEANQYGVYFDDTTSPHQYTLFVGTDFVSRDDSFDEIHKLPKTVEIYEINLGENKVVFNRVSGETNQDGNIKIGLISDISKTKIVTIDSSGRITLGQEPSSSILPSPKDSRHVHFDLGWSIQDATTLKFDFVNAGQIETVDMANYFNADKTEFDWDGTFSVGGIDQVFRIHTHSLSISNTLLCIHRDRNEGKNTEKVIIYIIDGGTNKDIAHYLADANDIVEKGFYVYNSMEIQ